MIMKDTGRVGDGQFSTVIYCKYIKLCFLPYALDIWRVEYLSHSGLHKTRYQIL